MAPAGTDLYQFAGFAIDVVGAVVATTAGAWLIGRHQRFGPAGPAIVAGLALTAAWCVAIAVAGHSGPVSDIAEAGRNIGWLVAIHQLFASDGRHSSLAPIRPVLLVLAGVELLHLAIELLVQGAGADADHVALAFDFTVLCRLLVSVGALVLVHNLYAGAARLSRPLLRWPAAGLAVLWVFDLNLYTIAYLGNDWPAEIAALRGLAAVALGCLIAIGASQDRDALRFRPSRAVTFQTFSLLVIGIYLIGMVAIAQWLSYAGGDFARLMELGFLTVASASAILILPSRRLRGWLKVTLAKHFFQHRYDYREEWLRFTRTIGHGGEEALPLGERVVQAVADIAEAPGGLLLAPGDHGELTLAARWQWPGVEVPGAAMAPAAVSFFERGGFIVDLDDLQAGAQGQAASAFVPAWLREESRAWALVPLLHYERLVGMVVLARPQVPRKFDWEDFDLLRVVGQQLASYLAEHAGQEALAEASRFDDFHRRIAFVMHDIKNLASQLSLLARNAELHAEKPAFRADMLVTLRNSADKLNHLLARLSRYGPGTVERLGEVAADEVVRSAVGHFRVDPRVTLGECHPCTTMANRESLEQVLVHLIQNAVDASGRDTPVFVSLHAEAMHARIEVLDSGTGMSPDFVRTRLFKPFVSSKPGGFGIGAFEARELVRAMHGRLEVESREGLGSRFIIRLPLAAATGLYENPQRLAS
jgi:putative PEP-CTERM system histidine kinase